MRQFLRQVADHYIEDGTLSERLFVFPNRRSMAFFRKYVADSLRESGSDTPVLEPRMLAVNDFFSRMTGRKVADRITLLLRLYDCYKALNPKAESLDDFLFWGDVILSDFADIDKYRVDARSLFTNVAEFRDIRDDFSYLSDEQYEAIRKLSSHFTRDNWTPASSGRDVKAGFLSIWKILLPLYESFRDALVKDGLAYEGMVYRDLADRVSDGGARDLLENAVPGVSGCVFVGLNALNECEKAVFKALKKEGLAEFCWDFSGPMISDNDNPASHFMAENIRLFGSAFSTDPDGLPKPVIHVIDVPSAAGQAKLLPGILRNVPESEAGLDFAVVLPDETMLLPVLSSLPDKVASVNVTMGYPLASSDFHSLMRSILALQIHSRGGSSFYHKQVYDIFSNGIFKSVLSDEENAVVAQVHKDAKSYIPLADLRHGDMFTRLFTPVIKDMKTPSSEQIVGLAKYLCDMSFEIAGRLDQNEDALQMECARQYYCCANRLADLDLPILPATFGHFLEQLVAGVSVPFSGEPLGGLQIMGPLETRALDFKRIVIMSADDGVFPRRNVRESFVIPEMRRAFGLPTYELQDSVWAYYFYRMISRAEEVWMAYDSRTDGIGTGEESRYIKQLRYLYGAYCTLDEASAMADIQSGSGEESIAKTPEDIEAIKGALLSASAIQNYISCPAKFYYGVVKKLYEQKEVSDNLDGGLLGEVCHDTLEALYCGEKAMMPSDKDFDKRERKRLFPPMGEVTREYLESWLSREDDLRRKVRSIICNKVRGVSVEGRDLVSAEIAVRYVKAVIEKDIERLGSRKSFYIVDLEKECRATIAGHSFRGYIDRLDSLGDGNLRIVDYKTGRDRQAVLDTAGDHQNIADTVFGYKHKDQTHDYKAALQFFVYDRLAATDESLKKSYSRTSNAMYAMSDIFSSPVTDWPVDEDFMDTMEENLVKLFEEMENPDIPFKKAQAYNGPCGFCEFAVLCGRASKN